MIMRFSLAFLVLIVLCQGAPAQFSPQQLDNWLERFPQADANGDGTLTIEEATAYRKTMQRGRGGDQRDAGGVPREFSVDPGWKNGQFPPYAVAYKSPAEIAEIFAKTPEGNRNPVVSYPLPADSSLRIVGTGHSFMATGLQDPFP